MTNACHNCGQAIAENGHTYTVDMKVYVTNWFQGEPSKTADIPPQDIENDLIRFCPDCINEAIDHWHKLLRNVRSNHAQRT